MIRFEKNNSTGLHNAVRTQETEKNNKEWQQNIDAKNNESQNTKGKKDLEMVKVSATNATSATNAVSMRFHNQEQAEQDESIGGNITTRNHKDAGRFDMKQDMHIFVKPPFISGKMLEKDSLWEMSKEILDVLDKTDAPLELKKRAARLLQEEQQVKAIVNGYQNSLIFS